MVAMIVRKFSSGLKRRLLLVNAEKPVLAEESILRQPVSPQANRRGVSIFFLMHGLCFASWASRIPTIQSALNLSASSLGTILFALPLGFFISLAFAGWLISKIGSRKAVVLSATLYSMSLVGIGLSTSPLQVAASLLLFGFFANLLNISVNTQAVAVEDLYQKRLMATFHGLWSIAGFAGAALGTWMIGNGVSPLQHFIFVCLFILMVIAISSFYLVEKDKPTDKKSPILALPDKSLLGLVSLLFVP